MKRRTFISMLPGARICAQPALETVVRRAAEEHAVPGLALAVFRAGQIAGRICHGVRSNDAAAKVATDTVFEAASLSKPVFATAVLRMAERGEIDIDKPLLEYLGGRYVHVQQPWQDNSATDELTDPRASKITARLVLAHRTGLPNWRFGRKLEFIREPGEWGYSGEGYVMLQRALERRTSTSLDELVGREVFRPLGMTASRFVWSDALVANVAHGHETNGTVRKQTGSRVAVSAGSLLTTLDEYVRFVQTFLQPRKSLLGERMRTQMLSPAGEGEEAIRWGLGWGLPVYDEPYLFHWGSNPGFRAFVLASLTTGNGLLFFTNSENGLKILPEVLPAVIGKELPLVKWRMLR